MAEEHDSPKETGPASILPKDKKQKQVAAIGIGLAVLVGAFFFLRKSGSSSAPTATSTTATDNSGAGVTYPGSGYQDQSMLQQFATSNQAQLQQFNQGIQSEFQTLTAQLQGMDVGQPGSPNSAGNDVQIGGKDLGPYLFGQQQVSFVRSNIGQYGYTSSIADQVQNAYNIVAQQLGVNVANEAHYSWLNSTTVEAIPPDLVNDNQIYTIHLSGAGANAGGSIVNAAGQHESWPSIWNNMQQPGVVNPSSSQQYQMGPQGVAPNTYITPSQ